MGCEQVFFQVAVSCMIRTPRHEITLSYYFLWKRNGLNVCFYLEGSGGLIETLSYLVSSPIVGMRPLSPQLLGGTIDTLTACRYGDLRQRARLSLLSRRARV